MFNFVSGVDEAIAQSLPVAPVETAPVIRESVTIRRPETRVTDVGKEPAAWTWEDLRNYVVRRIEAVHGAFPREMPKENAIFRSFASRWGALAGPIARFAFEECAGMWHGAPVRVTRFAKGSDPYFAQPIAERLQG